MLLFPQGIHKKLYRFLSCFRKNGMDNQALVENVEMHMFVEPADQAYTAYWEAYFENSAVESESSKIVPAEQQQALKTATASRKPLIEEVSGYF